MVKKLQEKNLAWFRESNALSIQHWDIHHKYIYFEKDFLMSSSQSGVVVKRLDCKYKDSVFKSHQWQIASLFCGME